MLVPPLIVIVGETASGKSALAIQLAKKFNGEIISADSRTVYTGMDIGTAKPSLVEREGIPHYGFDVVRPNEQFTVHDFQRLALAALADISGRGKVSIIVGGTGLYVDSVLYNYRFRPLHNPTQRAELRELSVNELRARVLSAGLPLPENDHNPRHLARLLESGIAPQQPKTLRPNTLVLGLSVDRELLRHRIAARVEAMANAGLIDEVKALREAYGSVEALRAPGYKAFGAYIEGAVDLDEAKRQFVQADVGLAKRQRTWFKRNKSIHWLSGNDSAAQAELLVASFLDSEQDS